MLTLDPASLGCEEHPLCFSQGTVHCGSMPTVWLQKADSLGYAASSALTIRAVRNPYHAMFVRSTLVWYGVFYGQLQ